jgi:hypothetical protein
VTPEQRARIAGRRARRQVDLSLQRTATLDCAERIIARSDQ